MKRRDVIIILVVFAVFGLGWYLKDQKVIPPINPGSSDADVEVQHLSQEDKAGKYSKAKELVDVQGFVNSEPFKLQDFIGKKVILVDFWTYSCINCQRTTPYLNSWWDKYKDQGLLIVGVHTPEFDFEKKLDNVKIGVSKLGIKYPVVQDNDYATWNAYGNRYWPRKYIIDIDGYIVYDHIGEGGYEETEMEIQKLLDERMKVLGMEGKISESLTKEGSGPEDVNSPETYFGSSRNQNFGNGTPGKMGSQTFARPKNIDLNNFYLVGDWDLVPEYAENKSKNASIIFKYDSRNVYFVAGSETGTKIKILQDGKPVSDVAGEDITKDGTGEGFIKENRLYKLISNPDPGFHTLEIIIEDPGLEAFTFTFG